MESAPGNAAPTPQPRLTDLPLSCAALIASCLNDERDIAHLRCSCSYWRDVYTDQAVWQAVLCRFGPAAAGDASTSSAQTQAAAEQRFRQLAALCQPVARMEKVVWLNGQYLQEVTEPGSTFGKAVKVHSVCWLELGGRFPGVLPGRYTVAWRCRLQGHFWLDSAQLIAEVVPAAPASPASVAASGQQEDEEEEQPHRVSKNVTWQDLQDIFQREGSAWFELEGPTLEVVAQPSTVVVQFQALSGNWKRGIVFDYARLRRQPQLPPAPAASRSCRLQ